MKRKLAAATATAALAVAGPAAATRAAPRSSGPVHGAKPRVTRVGAAESDGARQRLDALRSAERREHRHALASALAAELPAAGPDAVERGLAAADLQVSNYLGGQAKASPEGLAATLARTTGASEDQIADAFEAMARHALRNRHGE
jgi:hypothetical protein